MNAKELKLALVSKGWTEDAYGHMKKVTSGVSEGQPIEIQLRVKFQKMSVRLERAHRFPHDNSVKWYKLSSCYLKDVKVREDGGIIIQRHVVK